MHLLPRGILYLGGSIYVACSYFLSHIFASLFDLSQITRVYLIVSKKQRFISPQISSKRFFAMCNLSCNAVYFIARVTCALRELCVFFTHSSRRVKQHKSDAYLSLSLTLNTHKLALFFFKYPLAPPNIFISCILSTLWLLTSSALLLHIFLFLFLLI